MERSKEEKKQGIKEVLRKRIREGNRQGIRESEVWRRLPFVGSPIFISILGKYMVQLISERYAGGLTTAILGSGSSSEEELWETAEMAKWSVYWESIRSSSTDR